MIEPRERSEIVAPHITQQRLENGGFQRNADSEFCISVWRFKAGIKSAEGEIYELYNYMVLIPLCIFACLVL